MRFIDGTPVLAADPAETAAQSAVGTTRLIGATGMVAPQTRAVPMLDGTPPVVEPKEEIRRQRTRRLTTALVVLLVAVIVVAVLLLRSLGYLGGGTFGVPNVVGESRAAEQSLQAKGLVIGTTSTRTSSRASGQVVATDPGTSVKKGRRVDLVVSSGPAQEVVPKVTGENLSAAEVILTQANLGYHVDKFTPSSQPSGTVLTQNISPQTKVNKGTVVRLAGRGDTELGSGPRRVESQSGGRRRKDQLGPADRRQH